MNAEQILSFVREMAFSQGVYSRLYEQLTNDSTALDYLVEQNFAEPFDLVMFLES